MWKVYPGKAGFLFCTGFVGTKFAHVIVSYYRIFLSFLTKEN